MTQRENTVLEADPLVGINDPEEAFKNPAQLLYLRTLVDMLRSILRETVRRGSASPDILLLSPNGTTYRVRVADDGTLSTEAVSRAG